MLDCRVFNSHSISRLTHCFNCLRLRERDACASFERSTSSSRSRSSTDGVTLTSLSPLGISSTLACKLSIAARRGIREPNPFESVKNLNGPVRVALRGRPRVRVFKRFPRGGGHGGPPVQVLRQFLHTFRG